MQDQVFTIEGFDNLFTIADQSATQTTYGAIAANSDGVQFHSFFVTPFPDMVKPY